MVSAIGSSTGSGYGPAVSQTAGLESQIKRYQKQLSDCVNCDSAHTTAGKATIQAITNKINTAKALIEAINLTRPVTQAVGVAKPSESALAFDASNHQGGNAGFIPAVTTGLVGSQINVLA